MNDGGEKNGEDNAFKRFDYEGQKQMWWQLAMKKIEEAYFFQMILMVVTCICFKTEEN